MSRNIYTPDFYTDLDSSAEPSAKVIVPLLLSALDIKSVVDLGCGDGGWLEIFRKNGVAKIMGVDGDWVPKENLKIAAENFHEHSLDEPFSCEDSFDLAISLEVAEHLSPNRAKTFIKELTELAPTILFSAAIPGQGGVNHINEQWASYWKRLFAAHDYACIDLLRPKIWNDPNVTWWYKQNLILYVDREILNENEGLKLKPTIESEERLDIVHPELWLKTLKSKKPSFTSLLRRQFRQLREFIGKR